MTLGPLSVFDRYSKYSKVDVAKAIDLEMKGDIESCLTAIGKPPKLPFGFFQFEEMLFYSLILHFPPHIVKCTGSRPAFFAEKLNASMKVKQTADAAAFMHGLCPSDPFC